MRFSRPRPGSKRARPDAVLTLSAPGGEQVSYLIEARRSLTVPSLRSAVEQLNQFVDAADRDALPLLAAGYLASAFTRRC